jgi:putative ABC transport system permease protein
MGWWQITKRNGDLERELRSDLELEEEEQRASGLSPEEAHFAARRAFGNATLIREQAHEVWGWARFERFRQDVRFTLRQMRRSPGFTSICLIALSLGIGANTAVFSVIQAVILRPLPYYNPNRLVLLTDPKDPQDGGILLKDIELLQRDNHSLEDVASYYRDSGWSRVTLTGTQEPVSAQGGFVSANTFTLLGISPQLGRTFTRDEEARRDRVAVLSYGLWESRFGRSPDAIGDTIHLDGIAFKVIGVMPATFQFPAADSQLWVPITTNRYWGYPSAFAPDGSQSRGFYARWQAVARLKKTFSAPQAQAELDTVLNDLEGTSPDPNRSSGLKVLPLRVQVSGNTRLALYVLFASVSLLLLIACGNVASIILARGVARANELALREALGATRLRILRQLLTETFVLAILAGLFSMPCAILGTHALTAFGPASIPRLKQAGLSFPVLGFTFIIATICAMLAGLVPALVLSRRSPIEGMRSGTPAAPSARGMMNSRSLLVIFEIALSVVLLTCAGLLIHSFLIVRAVDPGFDAESVLKLSMTLSGGRSEWPATPYDAIVDRLRAVPGVTAAGAIDSMFDLGQTDNLGLRAIEGRAPEPRQQWTALTWDTVRGDYFAAIGAQLIRGRYFNDSDSARAPLVALIDQSMARRYWPGENPVGKRFKGQDRRGQNDDWLTVVGVVRDIRTHGLERPATSHVYEWYRQSGNPTADIVVRTIGDPATMAASLRAVVRDVAPRAILSQMMPVNQELQRQLAPRRFQTSLLGLFSWLALLLATLGVYGQMHYSVVQRTHEIGIRMALGADRSGILAMIFRQCLSLVAAGLALGLGLDWMTTRVLSQMLFGIRASDPFTLLAVSFILLAVSALASFQPAFKAASIDPMRALRAE